MSRRSSTPARALRAPLAAIAALALAACGGDSPTGAAQRNLGPETGFLRVDSVSPALNPATMTFAHLAITNVTGERIRVAACIEGVAAVIERPASGVAGAWVEAGATMCWGSSPRDGIRLEPGASIQASVQVSAVGRYRARVPYVLDRARDDARLATSDEFEVR